ncbi:hypothetical protein [Saliterribacillus persicus]|uniref:Uncharacterized protein n=1 Tax=Saliterribacillus persicus TaxID=930114 RepID=A0A368YAK1_9BACI|nr:hypothetical protein [Saliterribacillus persicus]RCW77291.1 hypothetical protein DFR57_101160 [Saliterribacillus persicus]
MRKRDPKDIEHKLKSFPKQGLTDEKKKQMHENIMNQLEEDQKNMTPLKKPLLHNKVWVSIATAAAIILIGLLSINQFFIGNENAEQNPQVEEEETAPPEEEPETSPDPAPETETEDQSPLENQEFTEVTALQLMQKYEETFTALIDDSDQQGEISMYSSTEEVRAHFREVLSEDLTDWMIDTYLEDRDGDIYLIAKDGPTFLVEDQNFSIEEESENHFKIIQERNNELLGHSEMTFHARWDDERWVLDEIDYTSLENPDTAEQAAQNIMEILDRQDMNQLAEEVHDEKGLLFSPYIHVEETAQVFTPAEVEELLSPESNAYNWGTYDGRGDPIELTPAQYIEEFVPTERVRAPDEINVNEYISRGNTISNLEERFSEATVVEYYVEGTNEYEGMDWFAVNFVLEQNENGVWKLVAIVSDQWTT